MLTPPHRTGPALLLLVLVLGLLGTPGPSRAAAPPDPPRQGPIFHCDGTYRGITVKHVRVAPGDTCVLRDSLVTGSFMARRPRTVQVLDTEVRRNLMVRGATGRVVIGNAGCRLDPVVGNNIAVTDSRHVSICWMTVKNNVRVTGNDGAISLFHNDVGRNIEVSRNERYVPDPSVRHRHPGAIRIRQNVAGGHIRAVDNAPGRRVYGEPTNSPVAVVR
jgi:hypothetical protein